MWFHVISCDFMCCDWVMWFCDVVMLWCCRSSHGWEDCPIRSSSSLKRLQAFQKSEWPMISNFNMSLNGLRFAHLAGEKEIQSRLLLMGMESGANCHELKFDFESKQVSSNSNSLNRCSMSPFSACRNSKYSLYPKYGSMSMAVFWHPKQFWIGKKMEALTSNRYSPNRFCSLKVTDSQLASVSRVHCIFELLSWKLTNA